MTVKTFPRTRAQLRKIMRIEIDESSGFCFGVTAAIRKAEEELVHERPLYCLGDIVHNGRECERLRAMGLVTINHDELPRLAGTRVLLRAHGEPPSTYIQAAQLGIQLVDATCPVVLRLQRRIRKVCEEAPDAQIIIYGKRGHAEVLGLVGQTAGRAIVVESLEEAAALPLHGDVYLFSQTTQPLEGFRQVVAQLTGRIQPPARFQYFDTICRQVVGRTARIQRFAASHDVILFVCGLKSSNGRVLHAACQHVNPRTHLVDEPQAIRPQWFSGAHSVGICGATSTPRWLMLDCQRTVEQLTKIEL